MAAKLTNKKSGFDCPAIGNVLPKGTRVKKLKDGKIKYIYPKTTANSNSKK